MDEKPAETTDASEAPPAEEKPAETTDASEAPPAEEKPAETTDASEAPPAEEKPARLERLTRDEKGLLVARISGRDEPVEDVRIARCFPWSLPESLISLRDKDGKELVLLETLEGLSAEARELIEKELRDKIFAPKIQRILSFRERFGITTVKAETDRGEVTFQLRHREDIRALSPTRCILKDVDGNMYEVPDVTLLDPASQRQLGTYF